MPSKKPPTQDAVELIALAAMRPTFDDLMTRDPATLTKEQRADIVQFYRLERAAWEAKEQKKADKKEAKEQEEAA